MSMLTAHSGAKRRRLQAVSCDKGISHLLENRVFSEYFKLECGHNLCPGCAMDTHMERGCGPFICPEIQCGLASAYTVHVKETTTGTRRNETILEASAPKYLAMPDEQKDPFRHFMSQPKKFRDDHIAMAMIYEDTENPANDRDDLIHGTQDSAVEDRDYSTVAATLPKSTFEMSEQDKDNLEAFFIKLHSILLDPTSAKGLEDVAPTGIMTPDDMVKKAMEDDSLLLRCLAALGQGSSDVIENAKKRGYYSNALLAVFVATEMLRRVNSSQPGLFQQVLAQHLKIHGVPTTLNAFLSKMRLSSSMKSVNIAEMSKIDELIRDGWNLETFRYGLVIMLFDNIGFRIRGASAGYDQYTLLMSKLVSKSILEELGVYGPSPLSREPGFDWERDHASVDVNDLLPDDKSDDILSERVLMQISAVQELGKDLFSVEEAKLRLEELERPGAPKHVFGMQLPSEYGTRVPVERNDTNNANVTSAVDDDEVQCEGRTQFDANGVKLDIPLHNDLACARTLKRIAEYCLHLRQTALGGSNDGTNSRPVMEDFGVAACCDGSPSYGFLCMIDQDPTLWKYFKPFFGPFHSYLELYKKRGSLLADAYLRDMYGQHRDSEKKQEYVLFPSDPSQVELEQTEMTTAILLHACRQAEERKGSPCSPVEVNDFMRTRAQEEPLAFVALLDLRLTDVLWMIRDSEKTGEKGSDPELFRAAMKYASILFSMTNAYKYVRILSEFAKYWYCASELDKVLYDELIFTQETVNGKRIWTDRFVEWTVKDIRFYEGKHMSPGQDAMLTRLALTLNEKKKMRVAGSKNDIVRDNKPKTLYVTRIFCSTLVFVDSLNLWGDGPVNYGCERTGYYPGVPGELRNPGGNCTLDKSILFFYSMGLERMRQYFNEYYITGELHQVTRPSSKVSLAKIPVLGADVDEAKRLDELFYSSKDANQLDISAFTKDDLYTQFDAENAVLPQNKRIRRPATNKKKLILCQAIVKVRVVAEQMRRSLANVRTRPPTNRSRVRTTEDISAELELPFYKLTDSIRQKYAQAICSVKRTEEAVVQHSMDRAVLLSSQSATSTVTAGSFNSTRV